MRAGESRASSRTKAQRENVDRQRWTMHRTIQAKPEAVPTRSWWLEPDFYATAKQERNRIAAVSKGKAE